MKLPEEEEELVIKCEWCGSKNRLVRGYQWYGKNKGKIKPIPTLLLCYTCGRNVWRNGKVNPDMIEAIPNKIPITQDESMPEEERIYSPDKTHWCRKTTKESADKLFASLEQLHEDMKKRGTKPIIPPIEEWIIKVCGNIYEYNPETAQYELKIV